MARCKDECQTDSSSNCRQSRTIEMQTYLGHSSSKTIGIGLVPAQQSSEPSHEPELGASAVKTEKDDGTMTHLIERLEKLVQDTRREERPGTVGKQR
eukprot:Em0021g500a